jgi:DNA processing protein
MSVRVCAAAVGPVESVCRHHCLYPERLRAKPGAPDVLTAVGGAERLVGVLGEGVVAIAAAPLPSDYGRRVGRALTRDLAVSGVAVAGVRDGLGEQACALAHEVGGTTLLIEMYESSERMDLECSLDEPASDRAIALLVDLVIVVEADPEDWDESRTEQTRSFGARVAAVPGPVDSANSLASNALIAEGADVVCTAQEALDALYGVGRRRVHRGRRRKPRERSLMIQPAPAAAAAPELAPETAAVLERVAGGEDTLAKLCAGKPACGDLALALTELELLGLLGRGEDGRYLMP